MQHFDKCPINEYEMLKLRRFHNAGVIVIPFPETPAGQFGRVVVAVPPVQGAGAIKFGRVAFSFQLLSISRHRPAPCIRQFPFNCDRLSGQLAY
jgi:hypothetical protein